MKLFWWTLPKVQLSDQKKQGRWYSGKKKKHTLKSQIVVNKTTQEILALAYSQGKKHDFRLFKESGFRVHSNIKIQADSGYQGLQKIHKNVDIPKKNSKKKPLTNQDKQQNKIISASCVCIENVIRFLKIFKIIAEKYRNQRKRFFLRLNLIPAIYNLQQIY